MLFVFKGRSIPRILYEENDLFGKENVELAGVKAYGINILSPVSIFT